MKCTFSPKIKKKSMKAKTSRSGRMKDVHKIDLHNNHKMKLLNKILDKKMGYEQNSYKEPTKTKKTKKKKRPASSNLCKKSQA